MHALHVKVAFFHTLVIHACVLYSSTSRLRTADLREMKAYTSIAPFQSTADSWEQDTSARTQHVGANCWEGVVRGRAEPLHTVSFLAKQSSSLLLKTGLLSCKTNSVHSLSSAEQYSWEGGVYVCAAKIEKAYGPTAPLRLKNYILIRSR